jgi:hypothetical protein
MAITPLTLLRESMYVNTIRELWPLQGVIENLSCEIPDKML